MLEDSAKTKKCTFRCLTLPLRRLLALLVWLPHRLLALLFNHPAGYLPHSCYRRGGQLPCFFPTAQAACYTLIIITRATCLAPVAIALATCLTFVLNIQAAFLLRSTSSLRSVRFERYRIMSTPLDEKESHKPGRIDRRPFHGPE